MAKTQSVRVTADPASVLNVLGATFSDTTTVIGELLQNGRRAGATKLVIQCTSDCLTVTDDGCGIANFGKLLAMAQSGWSSAIREAESPYGVGFLATLWSCETLEVISRGQRLIERTANLRDLCEVSTVSVPDDGLTHVILHGFRERAKLEERLSNLVLGFPIPVIYNGNAKGRLHALDAFPAVAIGIGQYHNKALTRARPFCYLQGLPIDADSKRGRNLAARRAGVLHLDPSKVFGRMPDRACVRNPEEVASAIETSILEYCAAELGKQLDELGPKAFASLHLDACREWGFDDLMERCAAVPAHWLKAFITAPEHESPWHDQPAQALSGTAIDRDALLAFPPVVINAWQPGDSIASRYFAFRAQRHVLWAQAPASHWVREIAIQLYDEDVSVKVIQGGRQEQIYIDEHLVTVQVTEQIRLSHPALGTVELNADEGLFDGQTLWVMPQADGSLVSQVTGFVEQDDDVNESARDHAEDDLGLLIDRLNGASLVKTLRTYIERGIPYTPPNALGGKRFVVSFHSDERGYTAFDLEELF